LTYSAALLICCSILFCIEQPGTRTNLTYMDLSKAYIGAQTEVCFELLGFRDARTGDALPAKLNSIDGKNSWFLHLFNIRFVLTPDDASVAGSDAADAASSDEHAGNSIAIVPSSSSGSSSSSSGGGGSGSAQPLESAVPAGMPNHVMTATPSEPSQYQHMNASADLLEFERRVRAAANAADVVSSGGSAAAEALVTIASFASNITSSNSSSGSSSDSLMKTAAAVNCAAGSFKEEHVWKHLQQQHEWPDGQVVFESLFHPCEALSPGSCVEMCGHD
jgi:hypothetical protein